MSTGIIPDMSPMNKIFWILLGATIQSLMLLALAISSETPRFVSRDGIIQFANFDVLDGYRLNVYALGTTMQDDDFMCAIQCLKASLCQSFDYQQGAVCTLLNANRNENTSALRRENGYKHFYIKSGCDSSPCRHGGTCQPLHHTGSYRCACNVGYTGYNCETCSGVALGMENGKIKAAQLSQSSYDSDNPIYGGDVARLNRAVWPQGALLKLGDIDGGWFQIDLLNTKIVTGFAMQGYGYPGSMSFTQSFQISSTTDNSSWSFVESSPGTPKTFPGNTKNPGIVTTTFVPAITCRYFKIVTKTCSQLCAFRLEVYGCDAFNPL